MRWQASTRCVRLTEQWRRIATVASAASGRDRQLEQRIGRSPMLSPRFARKTVAHGSHLASLIEILTEKSRSCKSASERVRPGVARAPKPTKPVSEANSGSLDSIERGIAD